MTTIFVWLWKECNKVFLLPLCGLQVTVTSSVCRLEFLINEKIKYATNIIIYVSITLLIIKLIIMNSM